MSYSHIKIRDGQKDLSYRVRKFPSKSKLINTSEAATELRKALVLLKHNISMGKELLPIEMHSLAKLLIIWSGFHPSEAVLEVPDAEETPYHFVRDELLHGEGKVRVVPKKEHMTRHGAHVVAEQYTPLIETVINHW